MMLPPSSHSEDVVQSPLIRADGNFVIFVIQTIWSAKLVKILQTKEYFRLFHAVDLAHNLPLTVLLLCKGEHVIEGGQFAE